MVGVNGVSFVKFLGEVDVYGVSGFLDFFEIFVLQIVFEFILDGDEVDCYFIFLSFVFYDSFEKFYEIMDLVEKLNVGICDGDFVSFIQVWVK